MRETKSVDQAFGVCFPNQDGVAGSKFDLEQGGFEIGMLGAFHLEANAVQGSKLLQPEGLRLRGLLTALLMPVKPARIHRHEQPCVEAPRS